MNINEQEQTLKEIDPRAAELALKLAQLTVSSFETIEDLDDAPAKLIALREFDAIAGMQTRLATYLHTGSQGELDIMSAEYEAFVNNVVLVMHDA